MHVQHVWPNRGLYKKGAPTKGRIFFAARVLNKMSMMTTVRVGPDSVG